MEYTNQYASNGKGNLGVTLGAIGTGLSILNGGLGFFGNGYVPEGKQWVTKDELDYVQQLSSKDQQISILQSENFTNSKIADVYERLKSDINAVERNQADINSAQAVYNASSNAAISVLQNQVSVLNGLTKTVIPNSNVCPGWGPVTVVPGFSGTTIS